MNNTWAIFGHNLSVGERKQAMVGTPGHEMPMTLINGTSPGKTVLLTAAVHADEYPGIAATVRVAKEVNPANVSGRIIFCHAVNTSGFWAKTRTVTCGSNLNANFPGSVDGSPGNRIADFFVKNIFPYVDFIIDLHSGGIMTPLTPCLYFSATPKDHVRMASLSAAHSTDIPYFLASRATAGLYSYAATTFDIPVLLLERGHTGQCHECWVKSYEKDIRLLLRHLEIYPFEYKGELCKKITFEKIVYPEAEISGLWYPAVTENMQVKKGDLLGVMEDFWGNRTAEYHAEGDGIVFYYESGLAAKAGETLLAYGLNDYAS